MNERVRVYGTRVWFQFHFNWKYWFHNDCVYINLFATHWKHVDCVTNRLYICMVEIEVYIYKTYVYLARLSDVNTWIQTEIQLWWDLYSLSPPSPLSSPPADASLFVSSFSLSLNPSPSLYCASVCMRSNVYPEKRALRAQSQIHYTKMCDGNGSTQILFFHTWIQSTITNARNGTTNRSIDRTK